MRAPGDRAWTLAIALAAGALYLATLCPTVFWYDSAEYAGEAAILGVAHPPGYPLYIPLAHLFTRLPIEPALGVNLLSALAGAAAVGLLFMVARRIGLGRPAAGLAALTLATIAPFWGNATIAEVYTVGLVFSLGTMLLLVEAAARGDRRRLYAAAALAGVGMGAHMSIATLGLGFALLVVAVAAGDKAGLRRVGTWGTTLAVGLTAAAAAAAIFATIPLRTAPDPFVLAPWQRLVFIARGGYFVKMLRDRPGDWTELATIHSAALTWPGVAAAVAGAVVMIRRRPLYGAALAAMAAGNLGFFLHYQTHDLEVFFLPAMAIGCLWIAAAAEAAAGRLPGRTQAAVWALGLALPLWLTIRNYAACDHSDDRSAAEYGEALVAELPEGAVLVKYDSPQEWKMWAVFNYFQKALRLRDDVVVLTHPRAEDLQARLRDGVPVYAFAAAPKVRKNLVVVEEGALVKVLRVVTPPTKKAPRG